MLLVILQVHVLNTVFRFYLQVSKEVQKGQVQSDLIYMFKWNYPFYTESPTEEGFTHSNHWCFLFCGLSCYTSARGWKCTDVPAVQHGVLQFHGWQNAADTDAELCTNYTNDRKDYTAKTYRPISTDCKHCLLNSVLLLSVMTVNCNKSLSL